VLVLVLSMLTAVIVGSFLVFDLVVTFPLDVSPADQCATCNLPVV